MKNYERITETPEALGAFLAALPIANAPWDDEFHKQFCADCLYLGCDSCPHEQFRNNPLWWLNMEAKRENKKAGTYDPGATYTFKLENVEVLEVLQEEAWGDRPAAVPAKPPKKKRKKKGRRKKHG